MESTLRLVHKTGNRWCLFFLLLGVAMGPVAQAHTPTMDAIIHITSVLMERDYAAEALRTPASLGVADLSAEELREL